MPTCLLSHLTAVKIPLFLFLLYYPWGALCEAWVIIVQVFRVRKQSLSHTHARAHTSTGVHTLKLVARLQLDTGALVFCQPQGKLAECSGEGEQRRAMLLTWQPSHHTKRVMSTDSTEICGILQRLHPLFISVHIIRTKARCNIITIKTCNLEPDNYLLFIYLFICWFVDSLSSQLIEWFFPAHFSCHYLLSLPAFLHIFPIIIFGFVIPKDAPVSPLEQIPVARRTVGITKCWPWF